MNNFLVKTSNRKESNRGKEIVVILKLHKRLLQYKQLSVNKFNNLKSDSLEF